MVLARGWVFGVALLGVFGSACGTETKGSQPTQDAGGDAMSGPCTEHADCADGDFCNGDETCDRDNPAANALGCVVAASVRACDDAIACTVDTCSGADNACVHAAPDVDGDGHLDVTCLDANSEAFGDDCDDTDADRYPGNVERCDVVDQDCNPLTLGSKDDDGDGSIDNTCCNTDDADDTERCGGDCDDEDIAQHKGQPEFCDGVDNDCDQATDEVENRVAWYPDNDGDGFGTDNDEMLSCAPLTGRSLLNTDCDDADDSLHPGVPEQCDTLDNNCNGVTDERVNNCQSAPPITDALPVNECFNALDDCDVHALCQDLQVGFRCTCSIGFSGDGRVCTASDQCPAGYMGTGGTNCTDIDECQTNGGDCDVDPIATCTNTPGSHTCACPSGFTTSDGGRTCNDIDECANNNGGCDMSPMVTCTNTPGSRTCGACPSGYATSDGGINCVDINECALSLDNCSSSPDACINTTSSFMCVCPLGYTTSDAGHTCDDIDECDINNGGCSSVPLIACTNTPGGRTCAACPTGYTGSGIGNCSDVDECANNNGGCSTDPMVSCVNSIGSRTCGACPTGYSGTGVGECTDTDECANNNGGCDQSPLATCTNIDGGRTCACPAGSTTSNGGVSCTDIDECQGSTVCTASYPCLNRAPYYTCRGQFPDWSVTTAPSFNNNFDGSMTDSTSGLQWERTHDTGLYTQSAAAGYCTALNLNGTGWRLPSRAELLTLVSDTRTSPTIDTSAFPNTSNFSFWTSTVVPGFPDSAWGIDFAYGELSGDYPSVQKRVRCVRSTGTTVAASGSGGTPPGRYTYPIAGSAYDTRTGLTWQRLLDTGTTYAQHQADDYCTTLTHPPGLGWRLPTRAELESLVDDTKFNPTIDTTAFPATPANPPFWTSTANVGPNSGFWTVNFYTGNSMWAGVTDQGAVRCVR